MGISNLNGNLGRLSKQTVMKKEVFSEKNKPGKNDPVKVKPQTQYGHYDDLYGKGVRPGDFSLAIEGECYLIYYKADDGSVCGERITKEKWDMLKGYNGTYFPD